ncbi:hypothetical protein V9K67_24560 [Paraflavisolibacter sp. H34]|uniref:hypothetical protein n=1 Tax=Huijunlia imazamoxiresistens TaxID=3127457 RepID=UPI003017C72A
MAMCVIRPQPPADQGASLRNNLFPFPGTDTLPGRCALVRVPFYFGRWNLRVEPLSDGDAPEARARGALAE